MPKIKIDHVVSFSSEDPSFPANNLLDPDPAKKWKCKSNGEKQAFVILQLEKASAISSIDIGNEHSAYVEILVARSDGSKDSDFKVLLVMSSFMTPVESRQSTNINKVRMFKFEELSSPEREEKWDRIKIVCTQPFNRHIQYGLSFITLHFLENKNSQTPVQQTIGKFALRPPSPDDFSIGSTFLKKKATAGDKPSSAAAAIRDAATSLPSFKPKWFNTTTNKTQQTPESAAKKARNRDDLLYSKDEEAPNEKIDKVMEEKKKENEEKREKEELLKQKEKEKKKEKAEPASKKQKKAETVKRRSENENDNTPRKKAKQKVTKPFNQLLSGATIVISGIQNPDRAELRTKALEMGAKYKPDWNDSTCTHLICAFANTPKFNQVKGKGKIVTRKWIENCHAQRKRLPWRRFALDKNDLGKPESEDEIWEETAAESEVIEDVDDIDDVVESVHITDGSDTEDEIERIQMRQQTEQNKNDDEIGDLLEHFFQNKTFHVDTVLNYKDRELITRYIIAYDGNLTKKPKEADVIVTNEDNVGVVKDLCGTETVCVSANWVFECHSAQKLIDFDEFKL